MELRKTFQPDVQAITSECAPLPASAVAKSYGGTRARGEGIERGQGQLQYFSDDYNGITKDISI
jgi:hypothetical protein